MGHSPERGSSRPREALPWLQNPSTSSIPGKSQGLCFTPRISNSSKAPEGTPGGNKQHLECWEFPEGGPELRTKMLGFHFPYCLHCKADGLCLSLPILTAASSILPIWTAHISFNSSSRDTEPAFHPELVWTEMQHKSSRIWSTALCSGTANP